MNQNVDNALGGFEQPDPNESYWTSGSDIKLDFLEQIKKTGEGEDCPTCGRYAKVYRRRLHSNVARQLILLHRLQFAAWKLDTSAGAVNSLPPRWVHTTAIREGSGYSDFTLAKHWGLIEAKPNLDDDTKKESGYWMLTDLGVRFVTDQVKIPKYIFLFDDRAQGSSDELAGIRDALGKNFNYSEIMEDHHVEA